jgi:DNA-binding transcriptional LysR family regulator
MSVSEAIPFTQRRLNRSALEDPRILSGEYWAELRVFLAVAKTGSFSRAAALLSTSQPTVSRQVKRLQDMMGARLLVPTQAGVALTHKGAQLAKSLTEVDNSIFNLSQDLRAEARGEQGLARVSVTEGLGLFFVVPGLQEFSKTHPMIQVALQSPLSVNDLKANNTEILIGFAPVQGSDVTCRALGTLHLLPVISKGYLAQYGLPTRQNLGEHLFIQSNLYSGPNWEPWTNLVEQGHVAHFSDNSFVYGMMVKAGLGIGLLGNYTAVEPATLPLELGLDFPIRIYITALTERLNSRPVRIVFDWMCELFGPANPWLQESLTLSAGPSVVDRGFQVMFNLPQGEAPPGRGSR